MIYYLIIAGIIVFDQLIKRVVTLHMNPGDTIPILENVLHITYVQNTGAAFSMWQEQWMIIVLFPAVALAAGLVVLFLKRHAWSVPMNTAIALICGGGIANLIDRLWRSYVVDFFDFRIFPVFNTADICICAGCALMIFEILIFDRKRTGK